MDREALKWFRENSSYTENSGSVGQTPIQYVGGRNAGFNFPDRAQVTPNKYFGTPAEFNANFQPGKFVSVESPPNEGKVLLSVKDFHLFYHYHYLRFQEKQFLWLC